MIMKGLPDLQGPRCRQYPKEGIRSFPPSANFLLCQWQKTDNLDLLDLLKNGMYVRDCRNFKGLEKNFFRVGFRMPDENDRLLEVIGASVNG
jgi:threonine-phosphate decarboxylase